MFRFGSLALPPRKERESNMPFQVLITYTSFLNQTKKQSSQKTYR